MIAVVNAICKEGAKKGASKTMCENSPRYSSGSNDIVERGIGLAVAQMRVMRSAVEDRLEIVLGSGHSCWAWLAEYAGYLLNRQEVGHDGKTSYERIKGKKAKTFGFEFMEAVLWKRKPSGGGLGKLAIMWNDGVFLGVKGTTGEFIIGDVGHPPDKDDNEEARRREVEEGRERQPLPDRRSAVEAERRRSEPRRRRHGLHGVLRGNEGGAGEEARVPEYTATPIRHPPGRRRDARAHRQVPRVPSAGWR